MLHDAVQEHTIEAKNQSAKEDSAKLQEIYHVLFTSHHLKSSTKRRHLQQWSASLSLDGFAKIGHPGVIYAQGERANLEEFVDNVKSMQWLALKVRFVEPVKVDILQHEATAHTRTWKEFQKVGEVVEEMRKIGREEFVVEMGIGSIGSSTKA